MRGVSIIICCFNSASRLPNTLNAISQLDCIDIKAEVIIVDNCSTDNTVQVAITEWGKFNSSIELNLVYENNPGLTNARMKGVTSAKYSYVIFCDDDNLLFRDYLSVAVRILDADPSIGALGGKCIGRSETDFPKWFNEFEQAYAVGCQSSVNGYLFDRLYLWGAGMITRKDILETVFDQDYPLLLSDRKGKSLTSGGDSEICARIILLGFKLYYTDELKLIHYVPSFRLTEEYRSKLYEGFYNSETILNLYSAFINTGRDKYMYRLFLNLILLVKVALRYVMTKDIHYLNRYLDQISISLRFNFLARSSEVKQIIRYVKMGRYNFYRQTPIGNQTKIFIK